QVAADVTIAPSGGLTGSATLINVPEGTDYSYDAVALADWRDAPMVTAPGAPRPDLDDVSPKRSVVWMPDATDGQMIVTGGASWGGANPVDPVSAVLMHESVMNEFEDRADLAAKTDWVFTFPTKRFYYAFVDSTRS